MYNCNVYLVGNVNVHLLPAGVQCNVYLVPRVLCGQCIITMYTGRLVVK